MKKLLAISLICVAAAAGAQSYDDRVAAERAVEAMEAVDKARMNEARARADQKAVDAARAAAPAPPAETDHPEIFALLLFAGLAWAVVAYARGKKGT